MVSKVTETKNGDERRTVIEHENGDRTTVETNREGSSVVEHTREGAREAHSRETNNDGHDTNVERHTDRD
jgi:hypothetical protein